jgi:hypothetical protein
MKVFTKVRILAAAFLCAVMLAPAHAAGPLDRILDALVPPTADTAPTTPVAAINADAGVVSPGNSSRIEEVPPVEVTIHADRVPFYRMLAVISDAGFKVKIQEGINVDQQVSIHADREPIGEVVDAISRAIGVSWRYRDRTFEFIRTVRLTYMIPLLQERTEFSQSITTGSGQSNTGGSSSSGFSTSSSGSGSSSSGATYGSAVSSASSSITSSWTGSVWDELLTGIRTALPTGSSNDARIMGSPEAGVLIVEAPARAAEGIHRFVTSVLRERMKMASISMVFIEVTQTSSNDHGMTLSGDARRHGSFGGFAIDGSNSDIVSGLTQLTLTGRTWDALIKAASGYGTAHMLSNPYVTVMNRMPTTVTRTRNIPFVERIDAQVSGTTGTTNRVPVIGNVRIGLSVTLIASIISDSQVLIAALPSVSDQVGQASFTVDSTVVTQPITLERAMPLRLLMNVNQPAVLGGLRITRADRSMNGAPGLNVLGDNRSDNEVSDLIFALRVDGVSVPEFQTTLDIAGLRDYHPEVVVSSGARQR